MTLTHGTLCINNAEMWRVLNQFAIIFFWLLYDILSTCDCIRMNSRKTDDGITDKDLEEKCHGIISGFYSVLSQ